MSAPDLPADLLAFLLAASPPTLEAGHYDAVTLFAPDELRVEALEVRPNMAPFARSHPHADDPGHYAVPAVNLARGDLLMFPPETTWPEILADPEPYVSAGDGETGGPVPVEYLVPWPRHPWVSGDGV